jgi:hypothetical protein
MSSLYFLSYKDPLLFLSSVTLDVTGGGFVGSVPTELGVLPRLRRRLDLTTTRRHYSLATW